MLMSGWSDLPRLLYDFSQRSHCILIGQISKINIIDLDAEQKEKQMFANKPNKFIKPHNEHNSHITIDEYVNTKCTQLHCGVNYICYD